MMRTAERSTWSELARWLERERPRVLRGLRPPLPAEERARIEADIEVSRGFALTAGLRDAYATFNGESGENEDGFFAAIAVPTDLEWIKMQRWKGLVEAWRASNTMFPRKKEFFVVGDDGAGNDLLVSLRDDAVLLRDHETHKFHRVARSWTEAWSSVGRGLAEGTIHLSEEGAWFHEHGESKGRRADGPEVLAAGFLQLLAQRRWVHVDAERAARDDLKSLGKALCARGVMGKSVRRALATIPWIRLDDLEEDALDIALEEFL